MQRQSVCIFYRVNLILPKMLEIKLNSSILILTSTKLSICLRALLYPIPSSHFYSLCLVTLTHHYYSLLGTFDIGLT